MPPARDNNTTRRKVRRKKPSKPAPKLFDQVQKVGKEAFPKAKQKPKVVRRDPGLGGRALADVAATAAAVSKGKKPPKATVRKKPQVRRDVGAGLGVTVRGSGKVKKTGGAGKLAALTVPFAAASPISAAVDVLTGGKRLKTALKIAKNAPKDAAEIAVTTPSSLYHLGDTLIHDPEKVPGMLLEPYKELARDPEKFITEKPVSSILMASGPARGITRGAGKGLRVAGKQTLKREPAVVPGTAVKIPRERSKDAVVNAVQARRDRKAGVVEAKPRQVKRLVDSTFDARMKAETRARTRAQKEAKAKGLTPEDADAHVKQAVKAAKVESKRELVKEFGATGRTGVPGSRRSDAKASRRAAEQELAAAGEALAPLRVRRKLAEADARAANARSGRGVPPKQHDKLLAAIADEDAAKVRVRSARGAQQSARSGHIAAKKEFREAGVVADPGANVGRLYTDRAEAQAVKKSLPFESTIVKVDNEYGVIPRDVADRLRHHSRVGKEPATPARVLRVSRSLFTRAVLPLSKNYVAGQAIEATGRSALMGAGPTSFVRGRRVLKRADAETAQAIKDRVFGEHYGEDGPLREALEDTRRPLKETFENTPLEKPAAAASKIGATPGIKQVRAGYRAWTEGVMKANAAIERQAQTAMLGKALKDSPLMERRIVGLSDKAIDDAVRGLSGTRAQVALGEAVTRAYGRYSRFGPDMRGFIMHWAPFMPWYLNTAVFLTRVLPGDHPVAAALAADIGHATEEWRKEQGLSLYGDVQVPDFLFGTGEDNTPIGRFLPFAPKDTLGSGSSLVLPSILPALKAAGGVDWKGDKLPEGQTNRAANAALSLLSAHVPGVSQADRLTGISKRHLNQGKDPSVLDGKTREQVLDDLGRMVNPLAKPKKVQKETLPRGVSQREFDRLKREAEEAKKRGGLPPGISQREFDRLKAAQEGN